MTRSHNTSKKSLSSPPPMHDFSHPKTPVVDLISTQFLDLTIGILTVLYRKENLGFDKRYNVWYTVYSTLEQSLNRLYNTLVCTLGIHTIHTSLPKVYLGCTVVEGVCTNKYLIVSIEGTMKHSTQVLLCISSTK